MSIRNQGGRDRFDEFLKDNNEAVSEKIKTNLKITANEASRSKTRILSDLKDEKENPPPLSNMQRALTEMDAKLAEDILAAMNGELIRLSYLAIWFDLCIAECMLILFDENGNFNGELNQLLQDKNPETLKCNALEGMVKDLIMGELSTKLPKHFPERAINDPNDPWLYFCKFVDNCLKDIEDRSPNPDYSENRLGMLNKSIQNRMGCLEAKNPIANAAYNFTHTYYRYAIEKYNAAYNALGGIIDNNYSAENIELARKICSEVAKEKESKKPKIPLHELTQTLILAHKAITEPGKSAENAPALMKQAKKLDHWKKRNAIALGLIILAASIVTAGLIAASVASFGVATPLTAMGLAITTTVLSQALLTTGAAVSLYAGSVGVGLFIKHHKEKLTKSPLRKAVEALGKETKPKPQK